MRITGYLTAHGVLDLVSTLFTFYRRSCSLFLYPSSGFPFCSAYFSSSSLGWHRCALGSVFSTGLFVLIPPKAFYRWSASQLVFGISCLSSVLSFAIYIFRGICSLALIYPDTNARVARSTITSYIYTYPPINP
jgi:hypothetical protein